MHPEDLETIESTLFARAREWPEKTALVDDRRSLSYGELAATTMATVARLRAAGLVPGDRVAIYLDKVVESVVALYAVWAAGAIAVPAHEGLRARQLRHILDDSGARLLLSTSSKLARLGRGAVDGVAWLDVATDAVTPGAAAPAESTQTVRCDGSRTAAAILYTSGSTGRPKGILVSHANLRAGARIVSDYLGMQADDRVISILPFSFDYGLNQLLTTVQVGATLYLQRSHFPPDICRALERHRISVMAAVPPLWIELMGDRSPFSAMSFPQLRILTNSGGVFPAALVQRYRAQLPHARLFLMYGLSEAFRSTFLPPELVEARPGSMGQAIPETEVYVVDPDDPSRLCADDEPGELVHCGPTVALGYWRNPEATAERFRRHPLAPASGQTVVFSGDLVRRDAQGFLYFVGRRDQMLKTQGHRVSPEEVEEVIRASGLVRHAIVRGEPDATAGAVLVAHLVPEETFSQKAFMDFCRREMPSYMVPKAVHLHRSWPQTASGKLDRNAEIDAAPLAGDSCSLRWSAGSFRPTAAADAET